MRRLSLLAVAVFACAPEDRSSEPAVAWESWRPGGVVGDTVSASDATIGSVLETAVTSRGQLLVLDGAERRVLAFDDAGRVLARGAGVGDGPGELRDPVALAVIAGDSLVLVDRTLRRIEVLTPVEDGLRPARSISLDFAPEAACVLEGDLFLLGSSGDVYLHRLAASGELASSWSPVPANPSLESQDAIAGYLRFALGGGRLACDGEVGLLVHAPDFHRQVYGIHPDGRIAWTLPLDSLVLRTITPRPGGVRFGLDPAHGYAEHVLRVTMLGSGQAQVLITRRFARDANREPEIRAIIVDVASGAVLRHVPSPRHFGVATRQWATEHLEEPAPAVRLWLR